MNSTYLACDILARALASLTAPSDGAREPAASGEPCAYRSDRDAPSLLASHREGAVFYCDIDESGSV